MISKEEGGVGNCGDAEDHGVYGGLNFAYQTRPKRSDGQI